MRVFAAIGVVALLVTGTMRAQAPPAAAAPATGAITGLMHAIHATNNVDTTLAFYTRLFGVMGQVQPFTNPNVPGFRSSYSGLTSFAPLDIALRERSMSAAVKAASETYPTRIVQSAFSSCCPKAGEAKSTHNTAAIAIFISCPSRMWPDT